MSVPRSAANFWKMTKGKVVEGVFAVNKPIGISSAQVIRDLQQHFNPSKLFAPWIQMEENKRAQESHNQQKRRKQKRIQVKIGHGGTLDPLATGVLITGVGRGTKSLQDFLLCTKEYETVVLFGTSTDTYDRFGKVLRKAPTDHITKEMVEEALEQYRGKFNQLPPLYSALKMNGKPLYEYAREGKEIPREIERRPVEVLNLEIVEWMEGGTHSHEAPTDEAGHAEINLVNKLWKQEGALPANGKRAESARKRSPSQDRKVKLEDENPYQSKESNNSLPSPMVDVVEEPVKAEEVQKDGVPITSDILKQETLTGDDESFAKPPIKSEAKTSSEEDGDIKTEQDLLANENESQQSRQLNFSTEEEKLQVFERQKRKMSEDQDDLIFDRPPTKNRKHQPTSTQSTAMMSGGLSDSPSDSPSTQSPPSPAMKSGPPAVRLRMTVTSGFYVRSLCHDLGNAVGSVALMAELERTRQGDYVVGDNALEYSDLAKGEDVWGPKVEKWLDAWEEKNPTGMRPRGGLARKSSIGEESMDRNSVGEVKKEYKSTGGYDGTFDEEREKARGFVGRDF